MILYYILNVLLYPWSLNLEYNLYKTVKTLSETWNCISYNLEF